MCGARSGGPAGATIAPATGANVAAAWGACTTTAAIRETVACSYTVTGLAQCSCVNDARMSTMRVTGACMLTSDISIRIK